MGEQTHPVGYEFGEFRVDIRQRALQVSADGRPLPIHSRAFDLLQFFLEHPGELCDGFLEGLNVAAHVTLLLHGGKDCE